MKVAHDLSFAPASWFHHVKALCFDIDDTFSSHGKITSPAFDMLWQLKKAGFVLIPVTGRPAGWCDHIARFWPVDAVVGENGAFTMYMNDQNRLCRIETLTNIESQTAKDKLVSLQVAIVKKFPMTKFASDQKYREYDLAIDICEDVPTWAESDVTELLNFCTGQGAIAKLSSIHVNTWFGRYTKVDGLQKCFNDVLPKILKNSISMNDAIFVGDSPNDEPLFQAFKKSTGVANLKRYLPNLKSPPTYITSTEAGLGFVELGQRLISHL
jgi:HAD superfamily hydrolase (TIGR01484 family)